MLKVGLKYCGGCRAQYDRVGLVASIRERLAGIVQFVSNENPEAQAILIVTGCKTACAKLPPTIAGLPIYSISTPKDAEVWIKEIQKVYDERKGLHPPLDAGG